MSVAALLVTPLYPGFILRGLAQGSETEPEAFPFGSQSGVALGTLNVTSNVVTISGLTITANFSLSGDATAEYSQNSGPWSTASGTCVQGDTFALRVDASGSYSTAVSATLTINGVPSSFVVTTLADPSLVPVFSGAKVSRLHIRR